MRRGIIDENNMSDDIAQYQPIISAYYISARCLEESLHLIIWDELELRGAEPPPAQPLLACIFSVVLITCITSIFNVIINDYKYQDDYV